MVNINETRDQGNLRFQETSHHATSIDQELCTDSLLCNTDTFASTESLTFVQTSVIMNDRTLCQ